MLTRLKVTGFKNLVDVDVRFGPFTCIAGANGVGKSNLFDAIRFLSALAEMPVVEAALLVRDASTRAFDVQNIFHKVGNEYAKEMSFVAEMIVPAEGVVSVLGQIAYASATYLQYSVSLGYRKSSATHSGGIELIREELTHLDLNEAKLKALFPHSKAWRKQAIKGDPNEASVFKIVSGESRKLTMLLSPASAASLEQWRMSHTFLSVFGNSVAQPAGTLAGQEMRSWRLLQLEPSELRKPDEFIAPSVIATNGSHLAATLNRLAHPMNGKRTTKAASAQVYSGIANRLYELLGEVREVEIDRDVKRELLTLLVKGKDGTVLPARALSDGTLRFLALAILEADPQAQGLFCLEEPENGIHPERIPAMIQLLRDIATDPTLPLGDDNPLRQVIINTHSPAVVAQVPEDSLLIAQTEEMVKEGKRFNGAVFSCLPNTWRDDGETLVVNCGKLLPYLNPVSGRPATNGKRERRVIDREDLAALTSLTTAKAKSR